MVAASYPSPQLLDDLVRRIVELAHPTRIILFGSAARGQMGPHSDLDLLLVFRDGTDIKSAEDNLYRTRWNLGVAKEFLVITEGDLQRFGTCRNLIYRTILAEGKEIYRAA